MPSTIENALVAQAIEAASEVARLIGAGQVTPKLLHHSQHISVLWPSVEIVAASLYVRRRVLRSAFRANLPSRGTSPQNGRQSFPRAPSFLPGRISGANSG
jgi:hypothetical protein